MSPDEPSVTERMRALVFTGVHEVVFYLRVEGEDFRFVQINPAFSRATGLSPEAVEGKLVDEIIPEPSLSLVKSKYREAIARKRTVRWEEATDYPSGRKYGEVSATPVFEEDERCCAIVGTVTDVTETSRARAIVSIERKVLEMVASNAALEETLTVLARGFEELNPPSMASVRLVSPDGSRLEAGAGPSLPEDYRRETDGTPIGPGASPCGRAAHLRSGVFTSDIATDPLWVEGRELAARFGLRACWAIPVFAGDGRVLGTFALYFRETRTPTPADLDLLSRATHVLGMAIQRSTLDEQLRLFSDRLEAAREDERSGIAREIHDQLGQLLTVLRMELSAVGRAASSPEGIPSAVVAERIGELTRRTDQLLHEVRRICARLRPEVLDDLGLVAALEWEAREFQKRTGLACEVQAPVAEGWRPERELSTTVFRIAQEALTNIERHAKAESVSIRIEVRGDWFLAEIRDDGRGIRIEEIQDPRSLGLLGIRERARRLGGTVLFARALPRGTVLSLRLPI